MIGNPAREKNTLSEKSGSVFIKMIFMTIERSQSVHSIVSDNKTIAEHAFCYFLSFIPRISVSRRTICLELSC